MKKYFYLTICISFLLLVNPDNKVQSQGCVAVRNMASPCGLAFDSTMQMGGQWQFSMNYRYFRSFRHFSGTEEHKNRVEAGTEVINKDNSLILGASYTHNNRWGFAAIIPLIYIDRSSLYEHKGNGSGERYHTQSKGLGDIRVSAYYSAIPETEKGVLTFGLGVKAPTGNYNYKDHFHKQDGLVLSPVDQSMQPGDGGWGISTEVNFNQRISSHFYGYLTGLYLINPRNTNGTLRSQNLTNDIPLSNEMSVTDQFLLRAGASFVRNNLQVGLGGRYEGIPVEDLIGDSDGFRRPGRILSIEPSVSYTIHHKHIFGLNLPFAVYRERTQSVIDKKRTEITGTYRHGDAAFADWLVSVFYAVRL